MQILTKHKKKGLEGFKKFVQFLGITSPVKTKEIISRAILEDPVYMKFALENIRTFNYVKELSSLDFQKIYDSLNNPTAMFICAFSETEMEGKLLNDLLPESIKKKYIEEKEYMKNIQTSQREVSRISILEHIFQLEETNSITKYNWKLPPEDVLKGDHFTIDKENNYVMKFEDGKIALSGKVESKLRSGIWKHYYPNGQLMAEGIYVNGEKQGKWMFHFADGKVKSIGEFKDNLKNGEWEEYDQSGKTITVTYSRGKQI